MSATGWMRRLLMLGLGGLLITGCAAGLLKEETVAERFDTAMKKLAERCAKNPPKPGNTDCDPLKLTPADPLATEEGRFAHSIKIPNPVPEDSGYKPGMTPEQYFDHLCKTEAGEFIFKTVEDVDGILQMRPRGLASDYELQHLYALEDSYGAYGDEERFEEYVNSPSADYVKNYSEKGYKLYKQKQFYKFIEKPRIVHVQTPFDQSKYVRYSRPDTDKLIFEGDRHFYPRDAQPKIVEERVQELKAKYGFTWRGVTRPHDRELGIVGGEIIIIDLQNQEVLAVRRGFIRTGKTRDTIGGIWWLSAGVCPKRDVGVTREFLLKVLKPVKAL